jgi:hypothetical protein
MGKVGTAETPPRGMSVYVSGAVAAASYLFPMTPKMTISDRDCSPWTTLNADSLRAWVATS